MKENILKIVSAVCIIVSLILLFLPASVELGGIKKSELRQYRKDTITDLDSVKEHVIGLYSNDLFVEDMEDNDLPRTKGSAKKKFRETEKILNSMLDGKISVLDIVALSAKAPRYIKDTENLLEAEFGINIISYSENMSYIELTDIIDSVTGYKFLFLIVAGFFIIFALFGILAAVLPIFNKLNILKWLYLAILILIVAAICVIMFLISPNLTDMFNLVGDMRDMTLKVGILPFVSIVLTIGSIVLDIVVKRTKKGE